MCASLVYHNTPCSRTACCRSTQCPVYGQGPCKNALPTLSQRTCKDSIFQSRVTMASPILLVQKLSLGSSASEHVQICMSGMRFQLTFGVHEELSACALGLNGSVARHHGPTHPCHTATQMLEDVLEVATLVEDVTGNSAPGTMFRNDCLHCAFRSRCQSGTGARGASIRPPCLTWLETQQNYRCQSEILVIGIGE